MPIKKQRENLQKARSSKKQKVGEGEYVDDDNQHVEDDDNQSGIDEYDDDSVSDAGSVNIPLSSILQTWPIDKTIERKILGLELVNCYKFNNDMVTYLLNSGIW